MMIAAVADRSAETRIAIDESPLDQSLALEAPDLVFPPIARSLDGSADPVDPPEAPQPPPSSDRAMLDSDGAILASDGAILAPIPPASPATGDAAAPPNIRARVIARDSATPISGAVVSDGKETVQTDVDGWFTLFGPERVGRVSVVAAGYDVVRGQTIWEGAAIALEAFEARAIYLPFGQLGNTASLAKLLDLARDGTINAVVIDVKEEGGGVLPLVATDAARALGAVLEPGSDIEAFLRELDRLGIYRIARVVTFLDRRFVLAYPDDAIRTTAGGVLDDGVFAWTDPFSARARAYNLAIGEQAATWFDEVQFDYIRFPGNPTLPFATQTSSADRSAAIARFAEEAATALHRRGAALSFATFGITTIDRDDGGIGQLLEDLAPHLDYYAPMLYPSTWPFGSFGLSYPAAHPVSIVLRATLAATQRAAGWPTMQIRPWLQDFADYGPLELPYGAGEVSGQIWAAGAAGAKGFMLWDPSLNYSVNAWDQADTIRDSSFAP